jgi:hypothetical protein
MERDKALTIAVVVVVVIAVVLLISGAFTGDFIRGGSKDRALKVFKEKVKEVWLGGDGYNILLTDVNEEGAIFVLTDPSGTERESNRIDSGMKELIGSVEVTVLSTQIDLNVVRGNWANIQVSLK